MTGAGTVPVTVRLAYGTRARLRELLGGQRQRRRELADRGWDRPWPACPPQARDLGRCPGSVDGGFPEQLSLRLPASLENQVRAACWYSSYEAIEALEEWRRRYPQAIPRRRWAPAGLESALEAYDRLAARVITTGEIWRAGIRRGMDAATGHRPVGAGGRPP